MQATCEHFCYSAREGESPTKTMLTDICGELLGTTFLVFIVCSTTTQESDLNVAVAYGLGTAIIVHWTNGLLNPALAVAMCSTGNLSIVKGLLFIIVEIAGGIGGAGIAYVLTPKIQRSSSILGDPVLNEQMTTIQGLFWEFVLTFILTLVVYASKDPGRKCRGYDAAIAYGTAVVVCHLVGSSYTVCGFNPARSFGPAVVRKATGLGKSRAEWETHWIFWIGPLCGSLLAGVLYHFFFTLPRQRQYDFINDTTSSEIAPTRCRRRNSDYQPESVL